MRGLTEAEEIEYLALLEAEESASIADAWRTGNLRYKLHEAQRKIYDIVRSAKTKAGDDVINLCARRFGKTYASCVMAAEDCLRNPDCIVRIVGPELYQTIEIVDFNMTKVALDAPAGLVRPTKNGRVWHIGHSQVHIGGFDRKNVKRNLGKEALNIYTEEACASRSEEFKVAMREILGPQLFHTRGRFVHATTPPEDLNHCFIKEFVPEAQKKGLFFKFTIDDNPRADAAMRADAIEKSGGEHTTAYRRNYLCEFVREDERSIIPLFRRALNVREMPRPDYAHWTVGLDLGFARDLSAATLSFWDAERRRHCIFDAAVWPRATDTATIVRELKALEARHRVTNPNRVVDDDPRSIRDLATLHGYPCHAPSKDELLAMLAAFNVAMGREEVEIHPRCEHLILSLEAGLWNERRTDFERTDLLGHWDSGMAAMYGFRAQDRMNPRPPYAGADPNTHFVPDVSTAQSRNPFGWDKAS